MAAFETFYLHVLILKLKLKKKKRKPQIITKFTSFLKRILAESRCLSCKCKHI